MDKPYPIENNKMQWVSGLPTSGEYLVVTINEKDIKQEDIYTQFETCRGKSRVVIPDINDQLVRFATQLLSWKMILKCRKDEFPLGVVVNVEHCVGGVQMAWVQYFLNESMDDCLDA
jgi:hypothetical protein